MLGGITQWRTLIGLRRWLADNRARFSVPRPGLLLLASACLVAYRIAGELLPAGRGPRVLLLACRSHVREVKVDDDASKKDNGDNDDNNSNHDYKYKNDENNCVDDKKTKVK